MPLYVYKCPVHSEFEKLLPLSQRMEEVPCIFPTSNFEDCPNRAKIQVAAPNMQPDKHWNGTKTISGKTVFSKSDYEEDNKYLVPASEANVNHVQKKRVELKREREEKHERRLDHFLSDQLRGVTIEPDGNTVRQKNRFNKMRHGD